MNLKFHIFADMEVLYKSLMQAYRIFLGSLNRSDLQLLTEANREDLVQGRTGTADYSKSIT